jgi:filamentous hemagglutinin
MGSGEEKLFMKLRQLVDDIVIDPRKLTDYALDPENPKGKDKARIFQKHLGYTKENYQLLIDQINQRVLDAEAIPQNEDRYGVRYQIDLEITGIEAQQVEIVRTGWLIPPDSRQARLTTLYIPTRSL